MFRRLFRQGAQYTLGLAGGAGRIEHRQAEAFVRKGLALLCPGGVLVFLLRLAFLEGQRRGAEGAGQGRQSNSND